MRKHKHLSCCLLAIAGLLCGTTTHASTAEKVAPVVMQQNVTVKGTVNGTDGFPLIGVNVVVKGTTQGTVTNIDGEFSLDAPVGAVIQFTYVGHVAQEITVTGSVTLTLVMKEDSQLMDEVVVVAYGTQKKANLTGAVASVNFNEVASMPVANTANMLQGRLPGVMLTNSGAQAGNDTPEIRIRGIGTLSDHNDPMVVIDGVESSVSQISEIPADDIENVSVLKDAASASIYGVRAANGVILITTKRGAQQKPSITYAGSVAIQQATVLADYLNGGDWAELFNEAKGAEIYTADMIAKIRNGSDRDHYADTKWLDEMFRTAAMHQHHLSVNGGSEHTHYMFSTQYFNQEGIMRNTANERFNFRSNIDSKLGIVKIGLNLSGSKQKIDEPTTSVTGEGLMRYITWFTRPTVPVAYDNGHYGYVDGTSLSHTIFKNPIEALYRGNKDHEVYRFDGKVFAEVDILKNLTFRSSLAYKYYAQELSTYSPRTKTYNAAGEVLATNTTNSLRDERNKTTTMVNENILTYSFSKAGHDISLLAGHSIQESRTDRNSAYIENFATDNLYEINAGTQNPSVSGDAFESSLQSFFGRVNYMYDSRYLFEFNVRHDGSSRMPKANRYATFPSFSAGWIISNEKFMENIDFLSSLKLRGSWGMLGNQEIGNYAYLQSLVVGGNYYFGGDKATGLKRPSIANDKIKWETTQITDIGFDASVWNNRINVTFDWFDKRTSDILLRLAMPPSFLGGLSAPYQNVGKVQNKGWELSANYYDNKGDFSWQAGFSLSAVKNKILDNNDTDNFGTNTVNREGYAINSFYGLKAIGIYRTEADLQRTTTVDGSERVITQYGVSPVLGDIMYEDINGDGNINDDDRDIIGNPFPKMQYSFNMGFGWKEFDISLFWQGVAGLDRYNWEQTTLSNGGNMTSRWLDRYSADNVDGSMPRVGGTYNDKYSSFWLTKGDYLRLKNIEVGYTFKQSALHHLGIQSIRLYLAGSNLLTFTSLDNYDPEKTSSDMRNDVHPNAKSYSLGVNVKF
ncbi:TonB-dependent receptor [Parabacteroides sp. OttesenSCG-928-N08]|nr:TonB-dependent receptor [Parabacteroides sp. OttesenSCG-928-N08]